MTEKIPRFVVENMKVFVAEMKRKGYIFYTMKEPCFNKRQQQ